MEKTMSKRCAIIGSTGYIGKHLAHYLRTMYQIGPVCYDIAPDDGMMSNYTQIDLIDKESIKRINLDADYIFLFSGMTGTHASFEHYEQYTMINEMGLLNLLNAISQSPYRPRIIFPSSRLVYKGVDKPLKEDDEKEAKTIYAANKIACEYMLQAYAKRYGIPYTIFRICVPYGNILSGDYSFGTVGAFLRRARAGEDISLYGGGTIKRTFTHIEDVCYQIVNGAFNTKENESVYNVGGETLSLHDAAEIIAKKYGVQVLSIDWPKKDLIIESGDTYFDNTKINAAILPFEYKKLRDFVEDL